MKKHLTKKVAQNNLCSNNIIKIECSIQYNIYSIKLFTNWLQVCIVLSLRKSVFDRFRFLVNALCPLELKRFPSILLSETLFYPWDDNEL